MARNLSTSLQERGCDSSLTELESCENLVEEYRTILEDQGYQYTRENVDDHYLATADPQNRAVTSRGNRLSIGQRNGDHYKAWLTKCNVLSNLLELEDGEDLSTKDDDKPPVPTSASFIENTRKKQEFSPYTMCLEKILLSDDSPWSFQFDDIIHITCDVMRRLADQHAKSIVYSDIRAGNIFINEYMRAFLIDSPRSKMESNKARLIRESACDVKALCKVLGGLCNFYKRNKPPDLQNSNQEAEAALFYLLRMGYRDGITEEDFLQEIGHIVQGADDKVTEQDVALKIKKRMEKQRDPKCLAVSKGQDSRTIMNASSQPCSALVNKQGPLLGSAVMNKQGPMLGSSVANNQCPELGSSVVDNPGPELGTAVKKQGPELGSSVYSENLSGHLELSSGDRENYSRADKESLTDDASTHEKLMSDLELEMFLSN